MAHAKTHAKHGKRILNVTIRHMIDDSPDTSWLGEYASRPNSEFSIDRAHDLDCASVELNHRQAVDKLERIISHLNTWRVAAGNDAASTDWESLDDSIDSLVGLQDELMECDCGFSGHWNAREYRYFNPSFNYVDKNGHALPENTAEEVRKYVRQDYERMESLDAGDWCFIGVRADAEIGVGDVSNCLTTQKITSGGLWGIESDSDSSFLNEEENSQLAELKDQLSALGFSKRAIATAFKNVERKDS